MTASQGQPIRCRFWCRLVPVAGADGGGACQRRSLTKPLLFAAFGVFWRGESQRGGSEKSDCGSSGRGFESLHSPQLPPWFAVDTPLPGLGRSLRSLSAIASLPGSGCPLRSGRFRAAAIGPAAAYTMPLPAQHDGHPKNGGRGPGVHLGQGCAQTGASLLGFRRREMQRQSLAQLAGAGGFLAGGELSHAEMKMVHRRLWGCLHALLQDR